MILHFLVPLIHIFQNLKFKILKVPVRKRNSPVVILVTHKPINKINKHWNKMYLKFKKT